MLDAASDDPRIQGTRALFDAVAAEPRLTATAVQTVGAKKWDGFLLASSVRLTRATDVHFARATALGRPMTDDPLGPLDPDFAAQFERDDRRRPPCQLYLVSPLDVGRRFPDRLARALDAGPVAAFQFRVKDVDQHDAARLAEPLQRICADRDVAFIVNDSVALAKRLGADGVHLGQDDGDPREARDVLGPDAQIGVTCHDSRHLAMEAGEAGADYVAFGSFYPTTTKDGAASARAVDPVAGGRRCSRCPASRSAGSRRPTPRRWSRRAPTSWRCAHAVWGGDEAAAVRAFAEVLAMTLRTRKQRAARSVRCASVSV